MCVCNHLIVHSLHNICLFVHIPTHTIYLKCHDRNPDSLSWKQQQTSEECCNSLIWVKDFVPKSQINT